MKSNFFIIILFSIIFFTVPSYATFCSQGKPVFDIEKDKPACLEIKEGSSGNSSKILIYRNGDKREIRMTVSLIPEIQNLLMEKGTYLQKGSQVIGKDGELYSIGGIYKNGKIEYIKLEKKETSIADYLITTVDATKHALSYTESWDDVVISDKSFILGNETECNNTGCVGQTVKYTGGKAESNYYINSNLHKVYSNECIMITTVHDSFMGLGTKGPEVVCSQQAAKYKVIDENRPSARENVANKSSEIVR